MDALTELLWGPNMRVIWVGHLTVIAGAATKFIVAWLQRQTRRMGDDNGLGTDLQQLDGSQGASEGD